MKITAFKGIGDTTAGLFHKLHIDTAEDLIHYYPRDYESFAAPTELAKADIEEIAAISGRILGNIATRHVRGLSITNFDVDCMCSTPPPTQST